MGQGYSTKQRQIYVPAKPVTFDDHPLPSDEPEQPGGPHHRAGSMGGGSTNRSANGADGKGPRRQSQNFNDPRTMSLAPGGSHRPAGGAAGGAANNDGEWMYNLDQLAHEHSKRKRRSVVKHHD